jgi:acetylornithine/N-succinyldiaminopimelate aminotransferase
MATVSEAPHSTKLPPLLADQLHTDPRLAEAKRLILAAVADYSSQLTKVRPANPALTGEYAQLLDEFSKLRGGALYFPYLSSGIGNGPFVELADGSVKLDLITGIGVHGYGHSHPEMVAAGIDAAVCDTVMQGNLQQDRYSVELSRLLTDLACESGAKLEHCFLSTSGAMANENSLKIAFQKHAPADRVICFEHCFAGRTLALAQLTDKAAYRQGLPTVLNVDYIPFYEAADPIGSTQRAVAKLREHLERFPGKHAVLWLELIQGEGGYHVGHHEFFVALAEVAHQHGLCVIADEVQTFCRTTRPYAFQHFGLDQHVDVVTIGKISQVCATLFTDTYKPKPGLVSQTFTGSTWSILAGLAIIRGLVANGNFGPDGLNMRWHGRFAAGLQKLADKYPKHIAGPYGLGGMVAFTPCGGSAEKAKEMCLKLYEAGLMCFLAGGNPTRLRFLLPLGSVEDQHIDLACELIESVVSKMECH